MLGTITFEYSPSTRRYWFGGVDVLGNYLNEVQRLVFSHEPNTEISDMRKFKNTDFDNVINGDTNHEIPF